MTKLLSLYGLKFHPFRPDVPIEALFTSPAVDSYLRRVELGIADDGFALLTGDPGTGKSVALRLLAERLRAPRRRRRPRARQARREAFPGRLRPAPEDQDDHAGGSQAMTTDELRRLLVAPEIVVVDL